MNNKQSLSKVPEKYLTDEELLIALRNRDENAIRYTYQAYWPVILHMVNTNNGSLAEAKDLYQESMLIFLEKIWNEKFVLTCKIKTFIYSICRNKWFDFLRGKQRFVDINDYIQIQDLSEEVIEEETGLPNEDQIRNAIISLGEPCHSLLIGFYYEKLSMEQLATKFNYKNVNVAKQQKYRCKDRLKHAFSEYF